MPGTKRVINIGTNPDDGTGDLLRDALNKVNLNFDDVWQYTSVNSNLDITGDSINGTTDVIINPADTGAFKVTGDTIINPDGGNYNFTINGDLHNNVLYVQASTGRIGVHNTSPTVTLDITGDTKVSGMTTANNLTVTGNTILGDTNTDTVTYNAKAASDFLPFSTTQNIGAPSNRWGYIYTTNLDVTGTIAGTFTGSMTSTLTGDVNNTNVTTVNANVTGPSNLTDVNISGNLVVQGTTTTLETTQVLVDNSIVFEGATDDAFETTLAITDPTADRTFTFPDASGTVATQEWANAQSFGGGGPADTDALTEGTTNLYYTDTRADARITAAGSANWNTAYGWGDHSTAGYLTSFTETNDLSSAVTWANVPDTNITESSVTQHQAALSITESQISDLGTYLTAETFTEVSQDTTPQLGGNLDAQAFNITTTGKILYANVYNTTGDLPSASTYHGMFAHVHGTGKGYFAHAGNWVALANENDLSSYQTTAGLNAAIDSHLNQSNPTSGYVLSWNGTDYAWVANAGSISDTDSLPEGASNLYYTDARADTRATLRITAASIGNLSDVDTTGATDGQALAWSSSNSRWEPLTISGSGIANVVEDTTPQLGGNLDGQTFDITTTGDITTNKLTVDTAENFSTAVFTSSGHEVNLSLDSTSTGGRAYMLVSGGTGGAFSGGRFGIYDADASLERFGIDSTGAIKFNNQYTFPTADGGANQVLQTDGSGNLSFATISGGGSSNAITQGDSAVTVTDTGTDGNVEFKTDNTVRWNINNSGHLLPEANATYDIGSASNKVRDLYLDANSLHIGSVDISESGGKLVMPAQELSGHLIPDTNATYDLGSAEYKIRHLFLSDNSLKFVNSSNTEFSLGVNATGNKLEYNSETVSTSSYETNDTAGAIDITKRHHFISGGVNYTLADGTYIGQELHFWRSATGSGYSDITIANAKWTIPGDTTDARTNFVWRTNGANAADNRTFMAVWDGAGWCLSGGTVAA